MRVVTAATAFYCLLIVGLVAVSPGDMGRPSLPRSVDAARDMPHARIVREAYQQYSRAKKVPFPSLLGKLDRASFQFRALVQAFEKIEQMRKAGFTAQNREKLREALEELKRRKRYLQAAVEHHNQWVSKVKIQLYLAAGIGLLGAVLGFLGFLISGGIGLALGGTAPLLYGVVSQPFPGEPLLFSAPLFVMGIVTLVVGIKRRKKAG